MADYAVQAAPHRALKEEVDPRPGALQLGRRAGRAFLAGVVFVLALAGVTAVLTAETAMHAREIRQVRDAGDALDRLAQAVTEAEAAQGQYMALGRQALLEPYYRSLVRLEDARQQAIHGLLQAGMPEDAARAPALLVAGIAANLRRPVETTFRAGMAAGRTAMSAGAPGPAIEQFREAVAQLRGDLQRRYETAAVAAWQSLDLLVTSIMLCLLGVLLLGSMEYLWFRRHIRLHHRTVEELHGTGERLKLLSALADALYAADDYDETYRVVQRFAKALLPRMAGDLYVYSDSRDRLDRAVSWSADRSPGDGEAVQFPPEACMAIRTGRVYRSGSDRPGASCAHIPADGRQHLCVPISARGRTSSVLHVQSAPNMSEKQLAQIEAAASALAQQLALALAKVQLQETLRAQAVRDSLTGLHNRRFVEDMLPRQIAQSQRAGRPFGLLLLDIDHFKRFNDRFGHATGDEVLRLVARQIPTALRHSDLTCRYGGEEFLVLLPDCDPAMALQVAEKVRRAVGASEPSDGAPPVTVSIGVAGCPADGGTAEAVIAAADGALYAAKRAGRNRCHPADGIAPGASAP